MNVTEKIRALWTIIRPIDGFVMGVGLIVGMFVAGSYELQLPFIFYVLVFSAGFFLSSHAMVINDIVDIDIDLINEPQRVLPQGKLTIKVAIIYSVILAIIGIVSFMLVDLSGHNKIPYLWLYGLFHLLLVDFYNYKLKENGFVGNITVAWTAYSLFLGADLFLNGKLTLIPQVLGIMAFSADLSREVYKGIIDQEGDAEHGVKTVAVLFGPKVAKYIATAIFSISIVVGIIAFPHVLLVGKIGMVIILVIYFYILYLAKDAEDPSISRKIKAYILLGPIIVAPFLIVDQIFKIVL